jgi:hypothetical protein
MWFGGLVVAGLSTTSLVILLTSGEQGAGLNRANYNRIWIGMPRANVIALFGGPPASSSTECFGTRASFDTFDTWTDGNNTVILISNDDGKVTGKMSSYRGPLDRILDTIKGRLQRWFP